ncbi:MAG TPA: TIGR03620 family F420-dependent LLM class oxidoreductase [Acidimicrobiales bacterium]
MAELTWGRVGVWTRELDRLPMRDAQATAAELEELGYRMLWVPEVIGREPISNAALLLSGTSELIVGAGVANIHARSATAMQAGWKTLTEAFPERFVLGLGVGVPGIVEAVHRQPYGKPYTAMVDYLDAFEKAPYVAKRPTAELQLVLAALRPRLMRLSAERSLGAMAYFVPVEHTTWAREILGAGPTLVIEQAVVVESDPSAAREIARRYMATYLQIPTYTDHLRDLGWTDDDLAGPSDALVDAIVAWGPPDAIATRVQAHLDAGADHVALQAVPADPRAVPVEEWRGLAQLAQAI